METTTPKHKASNKSERPFQNMGAGFAGDQPYEEDTASEMAKDEPFDPEEIALSHPPQYPG